MAPLRWGICGAGNIAKDFASSMMAVDGSELVAVASRRPSDGLSAFADNFGCRAHGNYAALAADAEVDAVYVATIHPTHYAITKLALEAGKHCMVEKPFGMNAREVSELTALASAKGVLLMEAMWTACLPATIEAMRMVSEGEIGEVQSANASVGGVWYAPGDLLDAEGRAAAKALGSGVLLDVGCCESMQHNTPRQGIPHELLDFGSASDRPFVQIDAIAVPYMFFRSMGVSD